MHFSLFGKQISVTVPSFDLPAHNVRRIAKFTPVLPTPKEGDRVNVGKESSADGHSGNSVRENLTQGTTVSTGRETLKEGSQMNANRQPSKDGASGNTGLENPKRRLIFKIGQKTPKNAKKPTWQSNPVYHMMHRELPSPAERVVHSIYAAVQRLRLSHEIERMLILEKINDEPEVESSKEQNNNGYYDDAQSTNQDTGPR